MKQSDPPVLATWLMSRLVSGPHSESLIGDLLEQYRQGRSSAWYWRQALSTIAASAIHQLQDHALVAFCIAALGVSIEPLFVRSAMPRWIFQLDRLWYPAVVDSRWNWLVVNPWAYRLQPYLLTSRLAWCGLLALVASVIGRLDSRRRGLAVAVFLITQVGACLPYLAQAVTDCLREPANPIWFFNAFWFAVFALIAIPCSVLGAGLGGQRRAQES